MSILLINHFCLLTERLLPRFLCIYIYIVPDLFSFGLCRLGRMIFEQTHLEPTLTGKALVYVGVVWVTLGCGKSLEDFSGKRTHATVQALLGGSRPQKYDPVVAFLLGAYGLQIDKIPDTDFKAFGGLVSTIYLIANSLMREPNHANLRSIYNVSPQGFATFCRSIDPCPRERHFKSSDQQQSYWHLTIFTIFNQFFQRSRPRRSHEEFFNHHHSCIISSLGPPQRWPPRAPKR